MPAASLHPSVGVTFSVSCLSSKETIGPATSGMEVKAACEELSLVIAPHLTLQTKTPEPGTHSAFGASVCYGI